MVINRPSLVVADPSFKTHSHSRTFTHTYTTRTLACILTLTCTCSLIYCHTDKFCFIVSDASLLFSLTILLIYFVFLISSPNIFSCYG